MATLRWNPPKLTTATAVYTWGVPYAAAQHEGATLRNGGTIPPRPWTEYPLENGLKLDEDLADNYRRSQNLGTAFKATATTYNRAMQEAIAASVWNWPRRTVRRSGEVAGSPRNVVDEGDLLNSQKLSFER